MFNVLKKNYYLKSLHQILLNDPDIISDPLREFIFNIHIESLFVRGKPLACLGGGLKKLHWLCGQDHSYRLKSVMESVCKQRFHCTQIKPSLFPVLLMKHSLTMNSAKLCLLQYASKDKKKKKYEQHCGHRHSFLFLSFLFSR